MRRLLISLTLLLLIPITGFADSSKGRNLDLREHHQREGWERIIPTHLKAQYAGSMGLLSVGFGWDYGKKCRWESDVMVGYVPKYSSDSGHATLTLKQNYIPWSIYPTDSFSIEPFYTGIYLNTIFGEEFWGRQPDRYPKGYYWFSTKLRIHLFWGSSLTLHTPHCRLKGVKLFFEVNTCDLYIVRRVGNRYLRPSDIIGLSCGIKFQLF